MTDTYELREQARSLLYRVDGFVAICRACGRVHEGTATFAIQHHAACWGAQLLGLAYEALLANDKA